MPTADHRENKICEGECQGGSNCAAENVQIETQPGLKQKNDEGNGRENGSNRTEIRWRYEVKDGTEEDPDDGQKKNIGYSSAAEQTRECVGNEDQETDDEDICSNVHRGRLRELLWQVRCYGQASWQCRLFESIP